MNHPGGAIGADLSHLNVNLQASAPSATSRDAGRRLSMSKERENPSSQVSTSSLLSLSQVRSGLKQNNGTSMSSTASTSSDDDDSQNHQKQSITPSAAANSPLSLSIQNNPTSVLSVKEQDLITCTKIQLLEWITLYDYIVAEKTNGSKTACESSRIKLIYRMECKNIVDGEWNMRKFTAAFSII